jgi:UDP-4-amino-4,6-dideoxy-N-acetyl-beta-L-altrosamine transaminase
MIPYGKQNINQDDINSVIDVLKSDFLTQGPQAPLFEKNVSNYCNSKFGIAVNSATSALHISCLALGLGKGDWLWTSPNTFVASANCALYCGAKVDFVDIDPLTYNLCPDELEKKLIQAKRVNKLPKIVIPVHFAGQSCDMKRIHSLSKEYGFKIIEDASHAIGSKYLNKTVGGCQYSDITVFSFHPVKIITTCEGGMALTNSEELSNCMRRLRTHGITNNKSITPPRPKNEIWNYQQIELGLNYRMTDIQAALGSSQITRLDEFVSRRHDIAKIYDIAFKQMPVTTPMQTPESYSSYHLYPILIKQSVSKKTQKQIYNVLIKNGVAANLHYIPVYRHAYYESLGFKPGYCPNAEDYFKSSISIPMFPSIAADSQSRVIEIINQELD